MEKVKKSKIRKECKFQKQPPEMLDKAFLNLDEMG